MLLAGDIGGTKTLLGLFEPQRPRPRLVAMQPYVTLDYTDLPSMIAAFAETWPAPDVATVACFGVAGPVIEDSASLTNVPWRVEREAVRRKFGLKRVVLLNDLQAMGYAVPVLQDDELHTLQRGDAAPNGNMAVIAAGTGLGQALLHAIDGRFIPSPTEGGHADFAPRNERQIVLLRDLIQRFGRASVEHVLSGRGLMNVHRVTHQEPCPIVEDPDDPDAPAQVSAAALEGRCADCVEALHIFVDVYGAEAGNLGLRSVSTAGMFVGGGIAPKILPALTDGRFMRAFVDKAPLDHMVRRMPVHVILNADAGLLGAAVRGSESI